MRDVKNLSKPVSSLDPANRTADADGTGVDLQGFEGALIVGQVGAEGDTLGASDDINLEVEESDDDSTYTDVADADLIGSVTGANTGTFAHVDDNAEAPGIFYAAYIGIKRYVRVVDNRTGTHSTGTPTSATVIGMLARKAPPS